MLFEPRTYRNSFSKERFQSFVVQYGEADLWIGVDPDSFQETMAAVALSVLTRSHDELSAYIGEEPFFRKSLKACPVTEPAPETVRQMAAAGALASIGPMAARAGVFAGLVGNALLEKFAIGELIVECGGDLFLKLQDSLIVSIFAGESDVSGMIGLEIPGGPTPIGIGTGAGSKGSPMNYGKADAMMIVARETALAGAFAVALGNLIKSPNEVDKVLKRTEVISEIEAAVLVMDDQIGLRGEFELKMLT